MRREHVSVLADVLRAVNELGSPSTVGLTRLATQANVAFDRLQSYLMDLGRMGLLAQEEPPRLTRAGYEFLAQHARWTQLLVDLGAVDVKVAAH